MTTMQFPSLFNQARATLFSLAILAFALVLLWAGNWLKNASPTTVTVRTVALSTPPPPPPPPPSVQQPMVDTPITLHVQGAGPVLQMLDVQQQKIDIQRPDAPALHTAQPQWKNLEVNWDTFSLDDLDDVPTLLTPLRTHLPKSITRLGINEVIVQLHIVVDENGKVELIKVVSNPYPELKPQIDQLVRSSRFTPPKKGNENVRVEFNWPIKIHS